jgi:ABC-type uncharacterized transport system substrate-binding protein
MTKRIIVPLALAGSLLAGATASAHPHVWVTMQSELLYAPDGSVRAVRHAWSFDDMFSVFATQGIDARKRGQFSREELKPLAQTNVESLKEFGYFTVAKVNGQTVEFDDPQADYFAEYTNSVLTLHFTLPLKKPVKAQEISFEIFDSLFFVDFSFADRNAAKLVGAPSGCKVSLQLPGQMEANLAARLSQLGVNEKVDPSMLLGSRYANKIVVKCP